jgi:hypothetical protein
MTRLTEDGLRRLSAEILAEVSRIDRTVAESAEARSALAAGEPARLDVYGAAALLDTFYTGVEKVLGRIAPPLGGGLPSGPAWHRRLLEDMALEIPEVRPSVLSEASIRSLEPYLSFRHRFRNLYLFDLEIDPLRWLLARLPDAWNRTRADLLTFVRFLRDLAAEA